jgi:hypothetical protein
MPFDGFHFEIVLPGPDPTIPNTYPHASGSISQRLRHVFRGCVGPLDSSLPHTATVGQLLRAARTLIADEARWVQGSYWWLGRRCAIGALRRASRRCSNSDAIAMAHLWLSRAADQRRFMSVEAMNDSSSHSEVLKAFDEAIAFAEAP